MAHVPPLPTRLLWITPRSAKFAAAYGGLVASYPRPVMITRVYYDGYGTATGIMIAPLTSTLNIAAVSDANRWCVVLVDSHLQCDRTAWAPVDWCDPLIDPPANIHEGIQPLRIRLCERERRRFFAKPCYIWVKDDGEFLSAAEWSIGAQSGEAMSLDDCVAMSPRSMDGCRQARRAIGKCSVVQIARSHDAENFIGRKVRNMY